MILTCPNCAAKFRIKDGALGEKGRKVRCGKCSTIWHAMPTDEDTLPPHNPQKENTRKENINADKAAETVATPEARNDVPAQPPHREDYNPTPPRSTGREADPPLIPDQETDDIATPKQKPPVKKRIPIIPWAVLILILAAGAFAGWRFAPNLVRAYPPIASIYQFIGLDWHEFANGFGLNEPKIFGPTEVVIIGEDNHKMVIKGEITSFLDREIKIPLLRAVILDSHDQVLKSWTFEASKSTVLPGEAVPFETSVFFNPRDGVIAVNIKFADKRKNAEYSTEETRTIGDGVYTQ